MTTPRRGDEARVVALAAGDDGVDFALGVLHEPYGGHAEEGLDAELFGFLEHGGHEHHVANAVELPYV